MAQCVVTIEMPDAWFPVFWGWFLDGGGESGLGTSLEQNLDGYEPGESFSNSDRNRKIIKFGMNAEDVKID